MNKLMYLNIELTDEQIGFIVYMAALFLGENDEGRKTPAAIKPQVTMANELINDIEKQTGITLGKILDEYSTKRKTDVNQS
jgi:hypothetical protein